MSRSGSAGSGVGGGAAARRRRSSGSGRRGACRGSSADHEEASLGVDLSRGGAEQGAPRRPMEERRPWRRRGCSGRREGARVDFLGARGASGGARVRLGANEGGESSGRGGTRGSGRSADGGEFWRVQGVLGRLKRAKGGEGGGLGCRWRAALKAGRGQRLGQVRGRARLALRRRRGAPCKPSRGAAWRRHVAAAMGRGKGQRACKRGTHGRQWP